MFTMEKIEEYQDAFFSFEKDATSLEILCKNKKNIHRKADFLCFCNISARLSVLANILEDFGFDGYRERAENVENDFSRVYSEEFYEDF